jgi:BirA family transcriptional regulator, biotin operon repressor / biotin---[acetyl-CoA-carboxylase] ligase
VARSPYTDLSRPPLNGPRLSRALVVPGGLWTRLDLRTETGSTNADAVAAGRAGEPEGLVVVAERQTAGRGRQGRAWTSPARAGLAVSVLLRPGQAPGALGGVPAGRYGWLPLLAGVALVQSVNRLTEVDAVLKWPNDLLVGGRKCAGILAEAVPAPGVVGFGGTAGGASSAPSAVVVGIGLNVTLREDELPADVGWDANVGGGMSAGQKATSLALAGATATDRDPLLRALLRSFAAWYERWRAAGGDPVSSGLATAYARYCDTLGRPVRVLLPAGGELTGTARELDGDGRLVVHTEAGQRHAVAAGDIRHVR